MCTPIDPHDFSTVSHHFRFFFTSTKNFTETFCQNRLSILSACEDPSNMVIFGFGGYVWPQRQTNQMDLEVDLMSDPQQQGLITTTCSYRNEPNPVVGRHDKIFPMFEFETHGNMEALIKLESEFLNYLGFSKYQNPITNEYFRFTYDELCKKYGVEELTHDHENRMSTDISPVVFITDFPESTNPFWNMKRANGKARKVDIIIHGIETFGSAERSCDVSDMRQRFFTIEGGAYSKKLFQEFGKERTLKELDDFMNLKFIERCGGGIGVTRLIRGMKLSGLL